MNISVGKTAPPVAPVLKPVQSNAQQYRIQKLHQRHGASRKPRAHHNATSAGGSHTAMARRLPRNNRRDHGARSSSLKQKPNNSNTPVRSASPPRKPRRQLTPDPDDCGTSTGSSYNVLKSPPRQPIRKGSLDSGDEAASGVIGVGSNKSEPPQRHYALSA